MPTSDPLSQTTDLATLRARVAELENALDPFHEIGQWLFARPVSDDEPVFAAEGIGHCVVLTRGDFKRASLARHPDIREARGIAAWTDPRDARIAELTEVQFRERLMHDWYIGAVADVNRLEVRIAELEAAPAFATARTLELVAEWLDEQQRTAQAKMDAGGGDWWEHERDIYWHTATALRSGAFAAWLREREARGG